MLIELLNMMIIPIILDYVYVQPSLNNTSSCISVLTDLQIRNNEVRSTSPINI